MRNYKEIFNTLVKTGGFTCSWNQLDSPTGNYFVSITNNTANIPKNERELKALLTAILGQKEYQKYIGDSSYCFGGWIDGELIYIDINQICNNLHKSLILAIENNQLAIFDNVNECVIKLPTPQIQGTETQKKNYLIKVKDSISQGKYYIKDNQVICKF